MTFKKKMKKIGNETLCKYSKNPYLIQKNEEKKRLPLWAKITIPSSLITAALIVVITITATSFNKNMYKNHVISYANKTFNNESQKVSDEYLNIYNQLVNDYYNIFYERSVNYPLSRDKEVKNILFSPIATINSAYMVYDIFNNEIKEEIAKKLYIDNDKYDYRNEINKSILNNIIDETNGDNKIYIDIAQALFVENREAPNLKQDFISEISKYYLFDVFCGDFGSYNNVNDLQLMMDYINEKTFNIYNPNNQTAKEFIDEILKMSQRQGGSMGGGDIHLCNVNYFTSNWGVDFDSISYLTNFNNFDGIVTSDIKYIESIYKGNISDNVDYFIVKIPLLNGYNFNILLPKKDTDYKTVLETNIDALININSNEFTNNTIRLVVPKFDVRYSYGLGGLIGLIDPRYLKGFDIGFLDEKDLGENNISTNNNLRFDCTGLGSTLSISESGVVASTASVLPVVMPASCYMPTIQYKITVDHPFAYSITDPQDMSLFVGQVISL